MTTITVILTALALNNAPVNDSTMKDNLKLKETKTEKVVIKGYKAIENGVADTFLKEIVEGDFVVNFVRICITDRSKNICRIAVTLRPFGERRSLVKVL